jgi:hypothetical protein
MGSGRIAWGHRHLQGPTRRRSSLRPGLELLEVRWLPTVLPTVVLELSGSPLPEAGGGAVVTARLSAVTDVDVTVRLSVSGTAVDESTSQPPALVIPAGVLVGSLPLTTIDDTIDEPDETIIVDIVDVTNAIEATPQEVIATILDDDPPPSLTIDDASLVEGDTGTNNIVFTVRLSAPSGKTVTVDFATADGTATAVDADYVGTGGTLTFAPGITTQTVNVAVIGDNRAEPDETFSVLLSNPTNVTLTNDRGTGTIRNDDAAPTTGDDPSQSPAPPGPAPDTIPPRVTSVALVRAGKGRSSSLSALKVTFSEDMSSDTVRNPGNYWIGIAKGRRMTRVGVTVMSYDPVSQIVTLTSTRRLKRGQLFTLNVTGGVSDVANNRLAGGDYSSGPLRV